MEMKIRELSQSHLNSRASKEMSLDSTTVSLKNSPYLFFLPLSPPHLQIWHSHFVFSFPKWLSSKEYACQCRRCGFDPWVGKITWRRKRQPLQYSCLGNLIERGAWWATVHGVAKELDTTKQQWLNRKTLVVTTIVVIVIRTVVIAVVQLANILKLMLYIH